MTNIKKNWAEFIKCEQGIAYVEFAISLTVLILLFLGSIEMTRYILIVQKVEKTVSTVTDVTTQVDPNSNTNTQISSQLSQMMSAVQDMMNPYIFGTNGLVIITDVTQAGTNNPVVHWQYCGGGTLSVKSKIGTAIGAAATLPTGYAMNAGEEVVIGETFYQYSPITTQNIIQAQTIYRTSIFMPRLGALTDYSSTCP
jgi:Flp pilus assembly protein TadG